MFHLDFQHNDARLVDASTSTAYTITFARETKWQNVGAMTALESRLRQFEQGKPICKNTASFRKVNDLIRYRLLECCFDWHNNNPWHGQTLLQALEACDPPCNQPGCENCLVKQGILGRGVNPGVDAWAKIVNSGDVWHVAYESETSHFDSAMWSLLRLDHAKKYGLWENKPVKAGTKGKDAVERISRCPTKPDCKSVDLGIVAMWFDTRPGKKNPNLPTYRNWIQTRSFHPTTTIPTMALFVKLHPVSKH